ncbi:FAD-dependent monooxygenase [Rhodococcus sp. P14]|uniref:FAD-dependent monooxygenase n=1 Tax=Rhodococcus sp. P14 TaxID=450821 RepID=UPI00029A565A|nr:FAD-dependent monooxygenase [Rhodococcus sp. P14]
MTHPARPEDRDPVVVVGGGPVGLTAALLLAKQNVPSIVLERRSERSEAPRAHVINPRSLEIYRMLDLDVSEMIAQAAAPEDDTASHFRWRTTGKRFGGVPFEQHDDTHTPHPRINLAQPRLERILLDEVGRSPLIDLRVGHRVSDLVAEKNTSVATVSTDDGQTYELSSDYTLACDGANSEVRQRLGIGLHGQPDVQPCLTIHFEGDLRDLVGDEPGMFYWSVGAKLPGILIAYDIDKTWVYLSFMAPEIVPSAAEAKDIVFDALGTDDVDITVRHVIPWVMTAQVADPFRAGRVFLVGDAAHRFPPSGGLGLNTGIQDAHNLAWKIAAVRNGVAGPELLDTYDTERRGVAEINTHQSLANAGSALRVFQLGEDAPQQDWDAAINGMRDGLNSLALQIGFTYAETSAPHTGVQGYVPRAEPGDRMPHAWYGNGGQPRSTLDLLDPHGFTLLTGPAGAWTDVNFGDRPVSVVPVRDDDAIPAWWVELTGIAGTGALLVRPDGHIAARVSADGVAEQESITHALQDLLRR